MNAPPRLARWIVGRLGPLEDRRFLLGDLDEAFAQRAASSVEGARRWYWRQTLSSIVPLSRMTMRSPRLSNASSPGDPMWRALLDDLKYALRLGRRGPLGVLAVVGTMVLGIGVTTAVFSVVNGILLKPLPFAESDRVIRLGTVLRSGQYVREMSVPDMKDFARDTRSVSGFTLASGEQVTLTQGSEPRQLNVVYVDPGYANVFDLHVAAGRLFAPDEYRFDSPKLALLADGFWRRQFGADAAIVGRTILLNNESYQVIGVLPPTAYTYPRPQADAILPLAIAPGSFKLNRGALWVEAFGKLRPGLSIASARAEMMEISARMTRDFPGEKQGTQLQVDPIRDGVVGDVRQMLMLLSVSVAVVLLIACLNIANLLLGRSQGRTREFAVRAALGGSGARIARQLLTESAALAAIGGALALALVRPLTRLFVSLYPGDLPRVNEIGIDGRVLLVAAVATVCAGIFSSVPLMRRAFALDLTRDLRTGARAGLSRGQRRTGAVLVVSQVALSLALLFAAGLLLQTFRSLSLTNPGFASNNLTTFHLWPAPVRHAGPAGVQQFYADVETGLRTIPGVADVAVGTDLPLGNDSNGDVFVDDTRGDQGIANPQARRAFVNPAYWATLGVPVLAGRAFTAADDSGSEKVMVVNQVLARRYYPGEDPVGRMVTWNTLHWRIVGVVGAMRMDNLTDAPEPAFYTPSTQIPMRPRFVVIKSLLASEQVIPAARRVVSQIDPTIPLTDIATMTQRVSVTVAPQRFRAVMVAALGLLAVVLSIVGIYGVVAYNVGRQTRDIGIRRALGEASANSTRRVVADALRPALIGAAIGIGLSLAAGRALASLLSGVGPGDIAALCCAAVLILTVATIAAYIPARRASRVDPLTALRGD